jgi:thymidine phosphorylase
VKEAVACLEPLAADTRHGVVSGLADLRELVLTCAAHLLVQAGKAKSLRAGRRKAEERLNSGDPRKKWDQMIVAQGGDLEALNRKLQLEHAAPMIAEVKSPRAGFISRCDARIIGEVIRDLGGGRLAKDSVINYDVGVDRIAKPGEKVSAGSLLGRIHAADSAQAGKAAARLRTAFNVQGRQLRQKPLVLQSLPA